MGLIAALGGVPIGQPFTAMGESNAAIRATVVEADVGFGLAGREQLPSDLIVEPEILHWPDGIPPMDFLPVPRGSVPLAGGQAITVSATGGGAPLAYARLHLHVRYRGAYDTVTGTTDMHGTGTLTIPAGYRAAALVVVPAGGFWPMTVRGEHITNVIECPPLPADGPLGWWHERVGIGAFDVDAGKGIKIGVIDTGVGPHPSLAHAKLVGAFVNGVFHPSHAAADVETHGSHVAATIGGRPPGRGDYAGIAPGCEMFIVRVFPDDETGASNADIANAIDMLSREYGVDLINLSLGATEPSQIVQDAIAAAGEIGTLCICAAGNDGGRVNFPGAFPEAIAVTALGLAGWGPSGSLTAARLPEGREMHGDNDLFAANFTSKGAEVDATAPGVGIVAAVPSHRGQTPLHGAMDGTSMASPVVCGCLAILLSLDGTYLAMPRQQTRTDAARRLLRSALCDVGLPTTVQGGGMPWIPKVAPATI